MESNKIRVAVYTFGCKVNLFESEQLKKSLINVEIVDSEEDADYYIINGCTVTSSSDSQVRNMARRFAKKGRVIITGCYARKEDKFMGEEEGITVVENIDAVATLFNSEFIYNIDCDRARPFIKIQEGCNQFCSYCIIPYVRGSELKSVPFEDIKKLLKTLSEQGFREVVLSGIHVGKYGADFRYEKRISDVVELSWEIIGRVRLSSIEPIEIDANLLKKAAEGKMLPHWHIPIQHGSDNILRAMNRPYTAAECAEYIIKVSEAYSSFPAIGTDIIAGFPGETERDFKQMVEFVEKLPFTYGHVFPFSPREGTPAWELHRKNPVAPDVIKERSKILRDIFEAKKEAFYKYNIGKETDMILEEEIEPNHFRGTSGNYMYLDYFGSGKLRELKKVVVEEKNSSYIGI